MDEGYVDILIRIQPWNEATGVSWPSTSSSDRGSVCRRQWLRNSANGQRGMDWFAGGWGMVAW
jgi:hypothetical protein